MKYYSALKKEGNPVISDKLNKPGGYCCKWNKPDSEKQILYELTYMWNIECQTHRSRGISGCQKWDLGREGENVEILVKGYTVSVIQDEYILEI